VVMQSQRCVTAGVRVCLHDRACVSNHHHNLCHRCCVGRVRSQCSCRRRSGHRRACAGRCVCADRVARHVQRSCLCVQLDFARRASPLNVVETSASPPSSSTTSTPPTPTPPTPTKITSAGDLFDERRNSEASSADGDDEFDASRALMVDSALRKLIERVCEVNVDAVDAVSTFDAVRASDVCMLTCDHSSPIRWRCCCSERRQRTL
jgi:hypothetical protein